MHRYLKNIILGGFLLTSASFTAKADIVDWVIDQIADQIRSEARNQVQSILNTTNDHLGFFGTMIWDGIVEAVAQSDLEEKALEFKKFPINRNGLNRVESRYPYKNLWNNYTDVSQIQSDLMNSLVHSTSNKKFGELGDGKIQQLTHNYSDSIAEVNNVKSLEAILSEQVMDSVFHYSQFHPEFEKTILADLNAEPRIAHIFNIYPQSVRVYSNSFQVERLRRSTTHLYYWGVDADSHKNLLPKKAKLINPKDVTFSNSANSVEISLNGKKLGSLSADLLNVTDVELMNLKGIPNITYIYDGNYWTTDNYGRVISAKQTQQKSNQHKSPYKLKLKGKDFAKAFGANPSSQAMLLNSDKYGAPNVLLNTIFVDKTGSNTQQKKEIEKLEKSEIKEHGSCTVAISIQYLNGSNNPARILVKPSTYPGHALQNAGSFPSDLHPVAPGSDRNADDEFIATLHKKSAAKVKANSKPTGTSVGPSAQSSSTATKASTQSTTSTSNASQSIEHYRFSGDIGGYAIVMQLDIIPSGDVSGDLYYTRIGSNSRLQVKGKATRSGGKWNITLKEYDQGKYNGEFRFTGVSLNRNASVSGNYSNTRNKHYTVSLTVCP